MEYKRIAITIGVTEQELELLKEYRHLNGGISRRAAIERMLRQHLKSDVDALKAGPTVHQAPAYIPSAVAPYQPPPSPTNSLVSNTSGEVNSETTKPLGDKGRKGLPRFSIS